MSLIPVEKAREQSTTFDMSQEQVVEKLSFYIDANSKAGARVVIMNFYKSAVSQQELDGALATVRSSGYAVEVLNNASDEEQFSIRVSW